MNETLIEPLTAGEAFLSIGLPVIFLATSLIVWMECAEERCGDRTDAELL